MDKPDEALGRETAERVDLEELFEEDTFRWQAADAGDVMEEVAVATWSLVTSVGHKVPVSKKEY